jgi:hypothetical protein
MVQGLVTRCDDRQHVAPLLPASSSCAVVLLAILVVALVGRYLRARDDKLSLEVQPQLSRKGPAKPG